jgi:hypothetical protein
LYYSTISNLAEGFHGKKFDINNLNETDIKLSLYMQELYDGFCSNKGLQYLIDKAREKFGRPLMLYDTSGKVLATSYDAESVFQFVTTENGNNYLNEDTLSQIYSNKISDNIQKESDSKEVLITSIVRFSIFFLILPVETLVL